MATPSMILPAAARSAAECLSFTARRSVITMALDGARTISVALKPAGKLPSQSGPTIR
ncbi:hypothetical protein D3C80_2070960 [compost metagenome]